MFDLRPTKYPIPLAFMGRKQSVDFSDTTLETWKRFIPLDNCQIKSGDKEIIIADAVKIQYGGFDDSNTVKKFNSAEYGFGFIDQAEEISRDDYGLFRGTLRLKIKNQPIDYKTLLTANPAVCWLKDEFILNTPPRSAFIQALPADNPFLPDSYVENLEEAFRHRPELVEAYIYGNWDVFAGGDLIIKPSWVEAAVGRELYSVDERCVVACDPARFGDDETVIYVMKGAQIVEEMIYGQKSTMETAGNLIALKNKHKAYLIAVDSIGVGSGICDRLRELKNYVLEINFASKATTEKKQERYFNRRTECYWEAGELFANDQVSLNKDNFLKSQLVNIKYKMNSRGLIQAEPKDKIKERMNGKSPDRADAFVMGLHALGFVPVKPRDFNRQPQRLDKNGYGWNNTKIGAFN